MLRILKDKPPTMLRTLTLLFLSCFAFTLRAQCPAPDLTQVSEYQRAATVFVSQIDTTADSLQIFLGDQFFLDIQDDYDTVYTFTEDLQRRALTLYDLEPATRYRVIARSFCGGEASASSGRGELFTTDSIGPPVNNTPGRFRILAGAAQQCVYFPATTRDATGPDVEGGACSGVDDDDVWFNLKQFYNSYRVNFRPIAGTDQDIVVEVYDGSLQFVACVDAGADGAAESYDVLDLEEAEEVFFRVFTKGNEGYADFEYCNFRIPDLEVATGTGCIDAPPVTFDGSGSAGDFVDILDANGAVVVSLENTQPLGEVNVSFYGHDGALRTTDSTQARYASRNISIVPTTQPAGPVVVRLYLSKDEVNQLIAAGAITTVGELDVTKVPAAVCSVDYPGGGEPVTLRGQAGPYGEGYYVDIEVTSFSEFFVHPAAESLSGTTGTSLVDARSAGWQLAPVPVTDRLWLTVPDPLRASPITVEVLDVSGRRLQQVQLPAGARHALNTVDWPRGIYVLRLRARGGEYVARVVK